MKFNYNNKAACIDLGSNLCRMLIGFANKNKPLGFSILKSAANAVRLGDKVYKTGLIQEDAANRTISFLYKCMQIAKQYDVKRIECVVTAACRLASNKNHIIKRIKNETGLNFRVIDPDEEIYLSSLGCSEIMPYKYSYVIDMGGCSTEIALCLKHNNSVHLKEWISLPIGILKFLESNSEYYMDQETENIIRQFAHRCMKNHAQQSIPFIIAKSGIMSTLANHTHSLKDIDIKILHGKILPLIQVKQSFGEIIRDIERNDRTNQKDISTRGSCIFIDKIISIISNISVIVMSNAGLREGLLSVACSKNNQKAFR
ncbi:hypothetical protein FZC35_00070 [Candidatus Cytomitobacter indipagum]|uniref:Ppx/GppA phosphatase N-terminal domain-containing protein n=1 Tax=Candidatus Cytomitobacter indipagum TaxID=2601575 RepID=A0A5C0UDT2_9PROT|nr:hypothetical protein [Candidatus Cytomitobacter indipagum]QEK37793.1 hypothetical protein FZC35_00070 [Candidatus Cytomitobacter indipagum]